VGGCDHRARFDARSADHGAAMRHTARAARWFSRRRDAGVSMPVLRIGNACGFWGDSPQAPLRLAIQAPDLDVLTLDYLAEVSMSILARQRERNPDLGFPRDLADVIRSLIPIWKTRRELKLITNGARL